MGNVIKDIFSSMNKAKQLELNREERAAERELTVLLKEMDMNNQKDTEKRRWNLDQINNFGQENLEQDSQGYFVLKKDADVSKTFQGELKSFENITNYLTQNNLVTTGDSELDREIASIHSRSLSQGRNFAQGNLRTNSNLPFIDDNNTDFLTEKDLVEFQTYWSQSGGYDNPNTLNDIVQLGIIDDKHLHRDETGNYSVYTTDGDGNIVVDKKITNKIDTAFNAFLEGVKQQESYLTNMEYEQKEKQDAMFSWQAAEAAVKSPIVLDASTQYEQSGKNIANILNISYTADDGIPTMIYKNNPEKVEDVIEMIQKQDAFKGLSIDMQKKLTELFNMMTTIGKDGSGLQQIIDALSIESSSNQIKMIQWLNVFAPGAQKNIATAIDNRAKLDTVKNATNTFFELPQLEGADVQINKEIENLLDNTGVRRVTLELRGLERQYGPDDPRIKKKIKQLNSTYDKAFLSLAQAGGKHYDPTIGGMSWDSEVHRILAEKLDQWIALEESTNALMGGF